MLLLPLVFHRLKCSLSWPFAHFQVPLQENRVPATFSRLFCRFHAMLWHCRKKFADFFKHCIHFFSLLFDQVRNFLEVSLEQGFGDQVHLNSKKMVSSDQTIKRLPNTCNLSFIGKNLEGYKILKHVKYLQASVGAACHSDKETKPSHILLACGINEDIARNALRLSVGRNTTRGDVTLVIDDLLRTVNMLKGGSKS